MSNLNLVVVKVEHNTKEGILDALRKLAEIDADFNGDNGEEYLWKEVKEHNKLLAEEDGEDYFDSNMEYLLDKLKELNGKKLVETYLKAWLDADGYWIDYKYEIVTDDDFVNDVIQSVSLATVS